jgi:hypothetical protein
VIDKDSVCSEVPNQSLQAAPDLALLFFLAQRPGAPELGC